MDVKVNESKFKKILFNYLNSQSEFKRAQEHRSGYGNNVREFFIESNFGEEDSPEFDWLFTYYKSPQDYEDISGVVSPYHPMQYPLIEYNSYDFNPILEMFGNDLTPKFILEWINDYFNTDASSFEAG